MHHPSPYMECGVLFSGGVLLGLMLLIIYASRTALCILCLHRGGRHVVAVVVAVVVIVVLV